MEHPEILHSTQESSISRFCPISLNPNPYNDKAKKVIEDLQKQLEQAKGRNKYLLKEINQIPDLENRVERLKNELQQKEYEYQELLNQNKNSGDNLITIHFISMLGIKDIGPFMLNCKRTDIFLRVEERFYINFPEFTKYELCFFVNNKKIKRFLTLDENNIKDQDVVVIFLSKN